MHIDRDCWSAMGLNVEAPYRSGLAHDDFLLVRFAVQASRGGAVLPRELCRSLAGWLAFQADGTGSEAVASCRPDAVRVAIDERRTELRRRSADVETSHEFRAGLAWAEHALAAVAEVASGVEQ